MKTKMTDLKTTAKSTLIKTARQIANEVRETVGTMQVTTREWRDTLLEHEESTKTLNDCFARVLIFEKALITLKNDVLKDLSDWSNANEVDPEVERQVVIAIYNGLKAIEVESEKTKVLNPLYKFHHTALERGYVRSGETRAEEYKGKFGEGLKLILENSNLRGKYAAYHRINYYIKVA